MGSTINPPQPYQQKLKFSDSVNMSVGAFSYLVDFSYYFPTSRTHIMIGKYCSIARQLVFNVGRNHPFKCITTYPEAYFNKFFTKEFRYPDFKNPMQVIIGNDVWIGQGVTIMGGVKIGNGAVIGANAVVAKDIPPYAIAVGNPARIIRYRFDKEMIKKFLAIKWWNWSLEKIADNFPIMNDPEKFLEVHYSPELEGFPEDDFSRQLKPLTGGGGGFINLSPTSKQLSRCGVRSSKTLSKQSWKTRYLSFGSARTRRTRTSKL